MVAHLTVGEHLVLVGNVAELGGWKVDVGRRMTWSEGDVWKARMPSPTPRRAWSSSLSATTTTTARADRHQQRQLRRELCAGEIVSVVEPAFVEKLTIEISAESEEAAKARAAIAEATRSLSEAKLQRKRTTNTSAANNEDGTTEEECV